MQSIRIASQNDVLNYAFSQKQNDESSLQAGGVAGKKGDARMTTVSADTLSISSEARAALKKDMAQAEQGFDDAQKQGNDSLQPVKSAEGKNISVNGKDLLEYVYNEYDKVCQEQRVSELPYYKRDDCQKIYDTLAEQGFGSSEGAQESYVDSAWDRLIFKSMSNVIRDTLSDAQAQYNAKMQEQQNAQHNAQKNGTTAQNIRSGAMSNYAQYAGHAAYSKLHLTA